MSSTIDDRRRADVVTEALRDWHESRGETCRFGDPRRSIPSIA
jgi:hypothetical protein